VNAVLHSHGVVVLRIVLDDDPARAHSVAFPLLGELCPPKHKGAAKSSAINIHRRDLLGGLIHVYRRAVA
jgi:hypothetical protein